MKIAVVAPGRHPIAEPYSGGLEAFCGILVDALRRRGHHVDLYAGEGSQGHVRDFELPRVDWSESPHQETDHTFPPGYQLREHAAYARLRQHLESSDYDVVHNNSLHPELLRSETLPLVTTLHCPPIPEMAAAAECSRSHFVAVSRATADSWPLRNIGVIHNAVNADVWRRGPGGKGAVFFGRIVREKGPHLAIDACRAAGVPLVLAGRCGDPEYFRNEIEPRLGADVTWIGHVAHTQLAQLVGQAAVAVISPAWDEPFGLVAIEAMATGTPVATFARGGLPEVLAGSSCVPVPADDIAALAEEILRARTIDRTEVAHFARSRYSLTRLVSDYEKVYASVAWVGPAPAEVAL